MIEQDSAQVPPGDQAAAVARHVVHVTAQYTGRGPTRARATFGDDVITVVLQDNFTRGERSLIESGRTDIVVESRRAYQQAMHDAFKRGIENITGRTIVAFLSDHEPHADIAVEVFVLAPV